MFIYYPLNLTNINNLMKISNNFSSIKLKNKRKKFIKKSYKIVKQDSSNDRDSIESL